MLSTQLAELRRFGGARLTEGLSDALLNRFAESDPRLAQAIGEALAAQAAIAAEFPALMDLDEAEQLSRVQSSFVNFYPDDGVNPYIAIAGRGPWVVTLKGAVVHDSGGYGMLGFGHAPDFVIEAMAQPQVMANVMTANVSQLRLAEALKREVGHTQGHCPYARFLCLNSGSESVTLAGRMIDTHTKRMTDPGAPHAGRKVRRLAMKGAFHGRTELPAMYSDSSRKAYAQHLHSYRFHEHQLLTIEPYSIAQLEQAFRQADEEGWHFEAMFLEPVMGEGDPGRAVPRAFYDAARELTAKHGALLLIDSIQAGLRAHGVLSIIDYPGFEGIVAPDFETYSKALNAGQYPLSVLAVTERTAALYQKGVYGNTMTTNPRAMDVACAVLAQLTPELRANIRERGAEFVQKLTALMQASGGALTKVQGTGLLFSAELSADYKCYGAGSIEEYLRRQGIGVIHGGVNSLRFTPPFGVSSAEVDLVVAAVADALVNGPRLTQPVVEPVRQAA